MRGERIVDLPTAGPAVGGTYGMQRVLLKLLVFAAMVLGLPLLGVWVAGKPVARYLEFPPTTRYVEHAPFSLPLFLLGTLLVLVPLAPFILRAVRHRPEQESAPRARPFPPWGWAGIVSGIVFWILAWTRFAWFAPFQEHTFTPLWLSFVVVVNALTFRKAGKCLLTERPGFFLLLFPASAAFWWSFEYLNRFVQNWYYLDPGAYGGWEYFRLATLPFSTVLPAVLSTREWLGTCPRLDSPFRNFLPLRIRRARTVSWMLLAAAAGSLAGIGVWPDLFYPLLWVSPLIVLVALDGIGGRRHILSGAAEGDWREIIRFCLAVLLCGFFWEMWNMYSLAKWEYSIPYVQRFLLFEMPLLGYSGYLPFGLECAAVAALVEELASPRSGRRLSGLSRTPAATPMRMPSIGMSPGNAPHFSGHGLSDFVVDGGEGDHRGGPLRRDLKTVRPEHRRTSPAGLHPVQEDRRYCRATLRPPGTSALHGDEDFR